MPAFMSAAISRMSQMAPTEVLPERCPATARICSASESRILCWASCGVNTSSLDSPDISVLVLELPLDDGRPGAHHIGHELLELGLDGQEVLVLIVGQLLERLRQHDDGLLKPLDSLLLVDQPGDQNLFHGDSPLKRLVHRGWRGGRFPLHVKGPHYLDSSKRPSFFMSSRERPKASGCLKWGLTCSGSIWTLFIRFSLSSMRVMG